MAAVYDHELNSALDQLIPSRPVSHRRRSSDPWFDAECRAAKRLTRRLERAYAAARRRHTTTTTSISSDGNSDIHPVTPIVADRHDNDAVAAAAVAAARRAWYDQRQAYRQLRHQKCKVPFAGLLGLGLGLEAWPWPLGFKFNQTKCRIRLKLSAVRLKF